MRVCGSEGEAASNPILGHRYKTHQGPEERSTKELQYWHHSNGGKMMAWTTVVLSAEDQLRQRIAFALSQILVIGEEGLGKQDEQEVWLKYYDIFVRNAFGSYRDVLWEVASSPMMATYLTFYGNRALHIVGTNPDENFSREIMQV